MQNVKVKCEEVIMLIFQQVIAKERKLSQLKVGDRVYAKHKNTRYYKATVANVIQQTFYSLDFDDGSFSDDTYPEDIVVSFALLLTVTHGLCCHLWWRHACFTYTSYSFQSG